jgi:hypothetical protein
VLVLGRVVFIFFALCRLLLCCRSSSVLCTPPPLPLPPLRLGFSVGLVLFHVLYALILLFLCRAVLVLFLVPFGFWAMGFHIDDVILKVLLACSMNGASSTQERVS